MFRKPFEIVHRARGYYSATIAGERFRLDPYHLKFWRKAKRGRWEPNTFKILSALLDKDSVYVDIGAWIGPTVLYASRLCKHVYCFEPDPNAYRYLCWNIALNELDNVTTISAALGDELAVTQMASFGESLGDSMTSLINKQPKGKTVDVLKFPWETFLDASGLDKPDLLKIDIEGGEFNLLPAISEYLAAHKPTLYLSTHAGYLEPGERRAAMESVVDVLQVYGVCLDENLDETDKSELLSDDAINDFKSFVFKA